MIEIKHQFTEETLVTVDADSLMGANLAGADLAAAQLAGCNLQGANLEGALLAMADLSGANLIDCNLQNANMASVNLSQAHLNNAQLQGANLTGAHLEVAVLSDCHLEGADLSGANMTGADLIRAQLQGTNMSRASLSYAVLTGAVFDDETQFPAWFLDPAAKGASHTKTYRPKPIDTSGVILPHDMIEFSEKLAMQAHEVWAAQSLSQGWTIGPSRNDAKKKHPFLIPYGTLPESEKEHYRKAAIETLKTIMAFGFGVSKRG